MCVLCIFLDIYYKYMYHIIYVFFSMNCNLCTTLEKHFNPIDTKQLLFEADATNILGFHKQGLSETSVEAIQ